MWHAGSWPLIEERPQRSLALSKIFLFMAAFSWSHVEAWLHVHWQGLGKKGRRPNNNFKPCTRLVTGSTGATTNEDIPLSSCSIANRNECPNYIVNFIQLATSAQQPATHSFKPITSQIQQFIPKCEYALKTGGAKRTVFTQQQKEIMIEYYNRQANYDIQADATECAATMRKRGLETLKDSQIKSWWSSYHQKNEREMERMAQHLQTAREGTTATLSNQPASTTQPTRSVPEVSASLPRWWWLLLRHCSRIMHDICVWNFLCDVSLYCGGLDWARSRMTTLVALIFEKKRFCEDFSKTVKLRFLYGLCYQGLYFVLIKHSLRYCKA